MLHLVVLLAFLGAHVAHVGAGFTYIGGELAAASHVTSGKTADLRAIDVELDATRQHFHVVLPQASGRAVIAFRRAGVAGIDAGFHLTMRHWCFLWRLGWEDEKRAPEDARFSRVY